jgi:tetratricopeptide (TPR) repeat protein
MHGEPTSLASATDKVTRRRQQELEQEIRHAPADVNIYLELARIYRTQQRHVDAVRVLERGSQHLADDVQLKWELEESQLARSLQRLTTAREVALQRPTEEHQLDLNRARTEWAVRRVEVCRARLSREPSQAKLQVILAEGLRDLGQFDEALREVEPATSSEEDAPAAHWVRGQCLLVLGRPLEALSAWRAASLRRSNPAPSEIRSRALRAATNLALQHGFYASAQRYLDELAKLHPTDLSIRDTLAKVRTLSINDEAHLVSPIELSEED